MLTWLEGRSSHQAQLFVTAILSGVAVAGAVLGVQAIQRQVAVNDRKASFPDADEKHDVETVRSGFQE